MNDMSSVIIPKSDQINADDLIAGPMTITITAVSVKGGQEQPVSVSFEGDRKVFRPCKSMCRVMVNGWGPDANKYVGRSMTLYRDPAVTWGAMAVGGIRISHMSDINSRMVMALTEKKGSRKPFIVEPLKIEQPKPAEDKITPGVNALVARIDATPDAAALEEITGDGAVIKQRAWLAKNRPELATKIDDAVSARLADFDGAPADDGLPGDTTEGAAS